MRGRFAGLVALVALGALGLPAAAGAAVSFTSQDYPLPAASSAYRGRTGAVSVADLNGDGRQDIMVYRGGGDQGRFFVLLNAGGGTFSAPQEHPVCPNEDGGTMVTGRFDAGPTVDVIIGCGSGLGFDRLLGAGDGTFDAPTHYGSIGFTYALALWPANGGTPNVLYSQSAGEGYLCYRPVNDLGSPVCPNDTSASDVNGPSGHAGIGPLLTTGRFYASACPRDDLILSPYQRAVRAWGMNPFGTATQPACSTLAFTERQVAGIPGAELLVGVVTADLNGDGTPDLLLPTTGGHLVTLLWQAGAVDLAGGFPPGQQPVVSPSLAGIDSQFENRAIEDQEVADFDGDGRIDVAVVGEATGVTTAQLAVQRGRGDGSFEPVAATLAVPGGFPDGFNTIGPNHLATGDLDADNRPDLVSIALNGVAVTVLLNRTPAPAPAPAAGTGPPAPLPRDTTPPALSTVRLTNATFAVARTPTAISARAPRGTELRYTLSEAARVTIAITRREAGRRRGKACVAPSRGLRRARRCTRSTVSGTLTRSGAAGANAVVFSGRVGRAALRAGSYRFVLTATDPAGNRSKPAEASFTVVAR